MGKIKNIFLDRDGTLIYDRHYLSDPEGVELLPGCLEGLRLLQASGHALFIVTNQSGIGRGYFSEAAYHACMERLYALLAAGGVKITASAFCPHDPANPEQNCACRKPGPAMWEKLRDAHGLRAQECLMIGDKPEDMAFARNNGFAAGVLVQSGKGAEYAAKRGLGALPESGFSILAKVSGPAAVPADIPTADPVAGLAMPDIFARDLHSAALALLQFDSAGI